MTTVYTNRHRMNIWIDENIPFAEEIFGDFGRLTFFDGRHFPIDTAKESGIEVLITRSVTPVTAQIADIGSLRFVGSATIGTDHVDVSALQKRGVAFVHAPGANAQSVAEYVLCAMAELHYLKTIIENDQKVGVVGYGQVGRRVTTLLSRLGARVLVFDPFVDVPHRQNVAQSDSIDEIMTLPVVTVHVPLTHSGPHPTVAMLDEKKLSKLPENALFINTSRGGTMRAADLIKAVNQDNARAWILDVWPNEPSVPLALLEWMQIHRERAIGTPHIAGHSVDGKVGGALMVARQLAQFLKKSWHPPALPLAEPMNIVVDDQKSPYEMLETVLTTVYPIRQQSDAFVSCGASVQEQFDQLRRAIAPRREFRFHHVTTKHGQLKQWLKALGFQVTG